MCSKLSMKRIAYVGLSLSLSACGGSYASGPGAQVPVVDLGAGDAALKAQAQALEVSPPTALVFKVPKGQPLPLRANIEGQMMHLERPMEGQLVFDQDMWVWFAGPDVLMSEDGERWRQWSEVLSGSLSLGAGLSSEGGAHADVTLRNARR